MIRHHSLLHNLFKYNLNLIRAVGKTIMLYRTLNSFAVYTSSTEVIEEVQAMGAEAAVATAGVAAVAALAAPAVSSAAVGAIGSAGSAGTAGSAGSGSSSFAGDVSTFGVPIAAGALPATPAALAAAVIAGVSAAELVPRFAQAVRVFPPAQSEKNPDIEAMSVIYTERKLPGCYIYHVLLHSNFLRH